MIKRLINFFEDYKIFSMIILWIIIIIIGYCSSIPGNSSTIPSFKWLPVTYHFLIFFLFSFFFIMITAEKKIKNIFIIIIFSLIVAILDEVHQTIVPFRSSNVGDVLIDFLGILFSSIIYLSNGILPKR